MRVAHPVKKFPTHVFQFSLLKYFYPPPPALVVEVIYINGFIFLSVSALAAEPIDVMAQNLAWDVA